MTYIKAYISQKLHLCIDMADYAAHDAYNDEDKKEFPWIIRFHLKSGATFCTEYDTKDKWIDVVEQIEKCLFGTVKCDHEWASQTNLSGDAFAYCKKCFSRS